MPGIPIRGGANSSFDPPLHQDKQTTEAGTLKGANSFVSISKNDITLFPALTSTVYVSEKVISKVPLKKEAYRGFGPSRGNDLFFHASLLSDHAMKVYKIELKSGKETTATTELGSQVKPLIFEVLTYNSANRYQAIHVLEENNLIQNNPFGEGDYIEPPKDLYLRKKAQLELYMERINNRVDVLNLQEIKDIFRSLKLDLSRKLPEKQDPNSDKFEPFTDNRKLSPSELADETMYQKLLVKEVLEFKKFLNEKGYQIALSPPSSDLGSKQLAIIYNAKKFTKIGTEKHALKGQALQVHLEEKSPAQGESPKKVAIVCCHLSPKVDYTKDILELERTNSALNYTTVLTGDTNRTDKDDSIEDGKTMLLMGDNLPKEKLPEGGSIGSVIGKKKGLERDVDRISVAAAGVSAVKVTLVFRQVFIDSHKTQVGKKKPRLISAVAIKPGTVIFNISTDKVSKAAQKALALFPK